MSDSSPRTWIYGGAALLVLLAALTPSARTMTPLIPMPFYLVMLTWAISYSAVLILPGIYVSTLPALWGSARFGAVVIWMAIALALLNTWWFVTSWGYGYRYQGTLHTKLVALENAVGLCLVIGLALAGRLRHSRPLQASAYLLMFAMLAWCAFPYLGETP